MTSQYLFIKLLTMHSVSNERTNRMSFSYKPLWKLLIDRDMKKKDLIQATGISKSTIDKMSRNEYVSLEVVDRLCAYFNCNIEDLIQHVREVN